MASADSMNRSAAARAAAVLGYERLRAGDLDAAHRILDQALPDLGGQAAMLWQGRTGANLGEALLALGRDDDADMSLSLAADKLLAARSEGEAAAVLARLGSLRLSAGNIDDSLRVLRRATELAEGAGVRRTGAIRSDLALAEAAANRLELSTPLFRDAAADCKRQELHRERAFALFGLAASATARGADGEARDALKTGLSLAREHGSPLLSTAGLALVVASRVLRGKADSASMALEAAESTLVRAGRKGGDFRPLSLLSNCLVTMRTDLHTDQHDPVRWRSHARAQLEPLIFVHQRPVLLRPDLGQEQEFSLASSSGYWEF